MSTTDPGAIAIGGSGDVKGCFSPQSVLPDIAFPPSDINLSSNNTKTLTNSTKRKPTLNCDNRVEMYPPSVSRSSNWGIGGFTTPPQLVYPPPYPTNTIASTLGNPQMPSVYLNSRAPMGFNFR